MTFGRDRGPTMDATVGLLLSAEFRSEAEFILSQVESISSNYVFPNISVQGERSAGEYPTPALEGRKHL